MPSAQHGAAVQTTPPKPHTKVQEIAEQIHFDPNTMLPGAQHPSLNYNATESTHRASEWRNFAQSQVGRACCRGTRGLNSDSVSLAEWARKVAGFGALLCRKNARIPRGSDAENSRILCSHVSGTFVGSRRRAEGVGGEECVEARCLGAKRGVCRRSGRWPCWLFQGSCGS